MASGAYLLFIHVLEDIRIKIGALGFMNFSKGFYIYVGSAVSQKKKRFLQNRVLRHCRLASQKKNHWHIDYLLASDQTKIERIILIPSKIHEECEIAEFFSKYCLSSVKRFGSSDCQCFSHLFYRKTLEFQPSE